MRNLLVNSTQVSKNGEYNTKLLLSHILTHWGVLTVVHIFKHFSDEAINLKVTDETSQSQLVWVVQSDCCHPCSVTQWDLEGHEHPPCALPLPQRQLLKFLSAGDKPTTLSRSGATGRHPFSVCSWPCRNHSANYAMNVSTGVRWEAFQGWLLAKGK